jgi:hypothetical protein
MASPQFTISSGKDSGLACRRRIPLIMLALITAACEAVSPRPPEILSADPSLVHPLVLGLDIVLDRPSAVTVLYEAGGPALVVESPDATVAHRLLLTRLRPSAAVDIEVLAEGSTMSVTATSGALPPQVSAIEVEGGTTAEGELVMFEVNSPDGFSGAVILDSEAHVVWFHQTEGALTGSTVRSNGNYVLVDLGRGLVEVGPSGEELSMLPTPDGRQIHHDVVEDAAGALLYLATDPRDWTDGRVVVGDAVGRWVPGSGSSIIWSAFDDLDPEVDWGERSRDSDWLHANSLSLGPRGNMVVSLNFLNQIISLAPDANSIEWRLGGPNGTIEVVPEGAFSGQHTAAELMGDRVLMFDNGFERNEPFSRALELRLVGNQAEVVADLRPNPENWSRAVSSAFRTDDGSTYVTYGLPTGLAGSTGPVESFVLGPAGDPRGHYRIVSGVRSVYRGTPLETVGGERVAR